FEVGTKAEDAILRVHDKVRANIDRIPVGIPEPLIVGRGIDDVAILTLTLSGGGVSAGDLTRIARVLQTEVTKTEDVGLTYLVGDAADAIRIEPDPDRLALYGVTLQQLAAKVAQANRVLNTGKLRDQGQMVDLVAGETLTAPAEVEHLFITTRDGRPVYVSDVATVRYVENTKDAIVSSLTRDGVHGPAVTLAVAKRAGANAVVVAEAVLHRVETLEPKVLPEGVTVTVTRDYGETANEKANELLFHLGLATVSIILLVWLAIGWREAGVVAIVIPVTILLTLFAAWVMGFTLNRVSLFALIFSIGILVDDAIVVIENIDRHWGMDRRKPRIQAAVEAVAEVGNPTIVATLTVVVALLPMLFVSGLMGPYMSPIPANASAAMIFSFFVAVIITPWLMVKIAGRTDMAEHAGDDVHGGHQGGWLARAYTAVARPLLKTKGRALVFLLVTAGLSFGSLALLYTRDVTVKLLPFDNKSELSVVIDLPEGSSVEATDRVARDVADVVMGLDEVTSAQTYAGTPAPFNFNGLVRHYYLRAEPQLGEVAINLVGKSDRDRESHDVALDLRERLSTLKVPEGTSLKVVEPPPGPPVISTLLAEVYGPDAKTRRAAAGMIRQAFEAVPFIVDVDDSFGTQARRLRATISSDDLEFYAVQEQDVFDTLAALNGGQTVGYSHRGEGRLPIPLVVGRDRSDRVLDERFLTTPIPANALPGARGVVELGDVVRVREEAASFPIFRHNGRDAEMVTAELAGDFEAPLYGMPAVADQIEKMDWPAGTKPEISLHGQPE
ncbi:MAG: efflux RND transporter permease subunit, partial [Acetobacteraceae bacterium]